MKSTMIPFSAIEISLASRNKNITREQAVYELENTLGFSLEAVSECEIMKEFLKKRTQLFTFHVLDRAKRLPKICQIDLVTSYMKQKMRKGKFLKTPQ